MSQAKNAEPPNPTQANSTLPNEFTCAAPASEASAEDKATHETSTVQSQASDTCFGNPKRN